MNYLNFFIHFLYFFLYSLKNIFTVYCELKKDVILIFTIIIILKQRLFLIGTFCIALDLYLACNARLTVYWRAHKFSGKEQILCFFTFNTDWAFLFWVDAYRCYSDAEKPRRIDHSVRFLQIYIF